MKKYIVLLIIAVISTVFSYNITSQTRKIFENWEVETRSDTTMLDRFIQNFIEDNARIGIGLGPEYGISGTNLEYEFKQFAVSAGGGIALNCGVGYNFAFRYYLKDKTYNWRSNVSFNYGTHTAFPYYVDFSTVNPDLVYSPHTYKGFSLGAGQSYWFGKTKKIGIGFDVYYITNWKKARNFTNDLNKSVDEFNKSSTLYPYLSLPHYMVNWFPVKLGVGMKFNI